MVACIIHVPSMYFCNQWRLAFSNTYLCIPFSFLDKRKFIAVLSYGYTKQLVHQTLMLIGEANAEIFH
uniref:Tubby-like F-box protein n=1 Tax=Rhizophora mucronata TaxID=61149 RepID=A0A2P2KLW9_RHIMU